MLTGLDRCQMHKWLVGAESQMERAERERGAAILTRTHWLGGNSFSNSLPFFSEIGQKSAS